MEAATDGSINPKSMHQLIRKQPARFRRPEEAKRLFGGKGGDVYSYSALIRELANLQLLREGVQLLIRMDAERIDITAHVFNIILDAYVNQGVTEGMEDLINIMRSRGIKPDRYTYTTLMRHYARQGDIDHCKQLMQDMTASNIPLDELVMGTLVECFFKADRQESALRVPEVMQTSFGIKPSIAIFNIIIKQLVGHGQGDKALRLYADLLRPGPSRDGSVQPDAYTYTPLMHASINAGRPDQAIELFGALKRAGIRPGVQHYTLLVAAHAAKDDIGGAVALLDEIEAQRVPVDVRLYRDYVRVCLDRGRVRELLHVCERMDRLGVRLDYPAGVRMMQFLDTAKIEDPADVESLMAIVRVIHKNGMSYRPTLFLEPYLDECRQQERPYEAVQLMERVLRAGGPKLHRAYFYAFDAMFSARNDGPARKAISRLHAEGLFK